MKKDKMPIGVASAIQKTTMPGREQKQDIIAGAHAEKSRNEMSYK